MLKFTLVLLALLAHLAAIVRSTHYFYTKTGGVARKQPDIGSQIVGLMPGGFCLRAKSWETRINQGFSWRNVYYKEKSVWVASSPISKWSLRFFCPKKLVLA